MQVIYDYLSYPFGILLGFFYNFVDGFFGSASYFVAIALFALVFKVILLPTAVKQQKSMAKQARLQPKIRRIQERYKGDKNAQQKIQEEQQALYQREGFNPMNQGCAPLLIQFPIIIGLYGAVYSPLTYMLKIDTAIIEQFKSAAEGLGMTVSSRMIEIDMINNIEKIRDALVQSGATIENLDAIVERISLFGSTQLQLFGVSLSANPSFKVFNFLLLIPILSFLTSMATSLISQMRSKRTNPAASNNAMMGCTTFGMPLFSAVMTTMFPAAVGIYWIINNVYTFIQTLIVGHFYSADKVIAENMVEETIVRRSKENNQKIVAERKKNETK
ncbi:MAG: YidC/Oxa1 family membrane protein insertase [Clostridia bacterium]|nr:YidC/Oxa1 family membrane protein insertase [Clostridia bacterium]